MFGVWLKTSMTKEVNVRYLYVRGLGFKSRIEQTLRVCSIANVLLPLQHILN